MNKVSIMHYTPYVLKWVMWYTLYIYNQGFNTIYQVVDFLIYISISMNFLCGLGQLFSN